MMKNKNKNKNKNKVSSLFSLQKKSVLRAKKEFNKIKSVATSIIWDIPGKYDLSEGVRAELIDKNCSVCDSKIEKVYIKVFDSSPRSLLGQSSRHYWKVKNARCKNCRIIFDY